MRISEICGLKNMIRDFEKAVADAKALIAKREIESGDVEAMDEILRSNFVVADRVYDIYNAIKKLAKEKKVPFYPRNDLRMRKLFAEVNERANSKEFIFNFAAFDAINAWYMISRYNARVVLKYLIVQSWS